MARLPDFALDATCPLCGERLAGIVKVTNAAEHERDLIRFTAKMDESALRQHLDVKHVADLAAAWDKGWDTAARCYWSKPRNPFSGRMNEDDPDDYCPAHGGTGHPLDCNANPLPYKDGLSQPCPGPKESNSATDA